MLVLSGPEIRAALTPAQVVASQDCAYRTAAAGTARHGHFHFAGPEPEDLVFAHGAVTGAAGVVFKTGVQVPGNSARGTATVQATVTVHDRETGVPLALLDGATVTTLRTAGGLVSAAATLTAPGPVRLGVFGTGAQAWELVRLAAAVLPLQQVSVWSPSAAGRDRVRRDERWRESGATVADGPEHLVRASTVVATCTTSAVPVFQGRWLGAGSTLLTMGSYAPDRCEIDLAATRRADLTFVDGPGAHLAVGPLVAAAAAGPWHPGSVSLVAAALDGAGRRRDDEVVIFHSSGLGVQDATLADAAYTAAVASGRGVHVDL